MRIKDYETKIGGQGPVRGLPLRDTGCLKDQDGKRTQVFRKNLNHHKVPMSTVFQSVSTSKFISPLHSQFPQEPLCSGPSQRLPFSPLS
jgi:hypothetical protein